MEITNEKFIQRIEFLEQLKTWREHEMIKVITGVRRCGKSILLELFKEHLKDAGVLGEQIISINLEDEEYEFLLEHKALHDYINERLLKDKWNYVFIDEPQNCPDWEKAVSSLFLRDKTDIYITGSNAYMLSSELATKLTGRNIQIDMLPLSFKEYSEKVENEDKRDRFQDFMNMGAFPYAANLIHDSLAHSQYLEGVYNTIINKDVMKRKGITDLSLVEAISKFLCSSVGSPVSASSIANYLTSNGRPTGVTTVETYINALCECYLFYKVQRYDTKGKIILKTDSKYYSCDSGIRNSILKIQNKDIGHILENIVYLELRRRGYTVNIGKVGKKEVDFVAVKNKKTEYYQVAASTLDPDTLKRELEPFKNIKDNYPKFLITLDDFYASDHDGIQQFNAINWLLDK